MDGRQPQRDRRGALIPFIIIAWILFHEPAHTRSPIPPRRPLINNVIEEEQRSLSVLQNSSWDTYFGAPGHTLNLTGLAPEHGYAWESLRDVKSRAREQLDYALGEWGTQALDGPVNDSNPVSLFTNIAGIVRGSWKRSHLQEAVAIPQLNLSAYAPLDPFGQSAVLRQFQKNLTGSEGDVTVHLKRESHLPHWSQEAANVTGIGASMKMTDKDSYSEWDIELTGVHFPVLGQVILTTCSDKFSGIFALPHFALSERTFEQARKLINDTISRTIKDQVDRRAESLNPWRVKVDGSQEVGQDNPGCELVVYLQQLSPVTNDHYAGSVIKLLEDELRSPTGAVLPKAPDLRFSMLAFSPDCGYVLESKGPPEDFVQDASHLVGPKLEALVSQSRRHILLFTFILALQLFLLMRQMREASTPSTRSRISFYTIAMLALGDGFVTMMFLLVSIYVSEVWLNLVGTAFLIFISVAFFGMRFLLDIWQVQAPERERRVRGEIEEEQRREVAFHETLRRLREEREHRSAALTTAAIPDSTISTPAETTQSPVAGQHLDTVAPPRPIIQRPIDTGATPVFMPSDQEGILPAGPATAPDPSDMNALVRARMPSFMSLYGRFYLLLLGTLFLSINAILWPAPLRRAYFTFLGLLYVSFWIPQILRNVQRNCRHALNWEFVFGQSLLRLTPFGYVYAYKHNVIFTDVDYTSLILLAMWLWVQVVVLVSQELIGPRWFIRKDWAPPAYDYHPILREDEEGATMPIGFSQATRDSSAPASPISDRTPSSPSLARRASVPKETKEKGKRVFDCAICVQELEVPVVEAGAANDSGLAGGILARRNYMVTPCRHIFHSACLQGWMKYRLQCPICRETLPPL